MISNCEYIRQSFRKESDTDSLAPQNFRRINSIRSKGGASDEVIHETIMDLKVLRMKKIMVKYGTVILSREQAGEIWGGNV